MFRLAALLPAAALLAACATETTYSPADVVAAEADLSGRTRYIVAFKDVAAGKRALASARAEVVMDISGMRASAALIPPAAVNGLQNNPAIDYIEVDAVREPFSQTIPYGITLTQSDQVWATTRGGNVKVCVIDSGLWTGHEDMQITKSLTGISGSTDWKTDGCGHGTHVAGTIAALSNTVGVVGVNPDGAPLHIVKVFKDDCAWTYASGLADAVNKCVENAAGARMVINMSLGGSFKSRTEENALKNAFNKGVLSVAAAGNDGTNRKSFPASYPVVISVGALDSNKQRASFSQYNNEVDLAAPGVAVNSTVPWLDQSKISVGTSSVFGSHIEGSARGTASGALLYGGLCKLGSGNSTWAGKVVICDRGDVGFNEKVQEVQKNGGVAAIIANNVSGGFTGTLGSGNTSTIVGLAISQEDGTLLKNAAGQTASVSSTVTKPASGYEAWNGTSMASPHVAGIAALIWSPKTSRTPGQIREAMEKTAEDLGAAGRDDFYGHGLVRAKAALDYLNRVYP